MADSKKKEESGFFARVKTEFTEKITWPSKESVFKQSIVVTISAIAVGVVVAVLDFLIQYGVNFITQ